MLDFHVSAAEVFWKSGDTGAAIVAARDALDCEVSYEQSVALWIFIARAESKLGNYDESNKILRRLIDEKIYLPPVILTLFYNSLKTGKTEKSLRNLDLVRLFV